MSNPFLRIFYGVEGKYIEVTELALKYFTRPGPSLAGQAKDVSPSLVIHRELVIPAGDCARAAIFSDPLLGILKHVKVILNDETVIVSHAEKAILDISSLDYQPVEILLDHLDPQTKLSVIHSRVTLEGGSMTDEYPEQVMAATYIKPSNKVLELGSNIGRNTLVIASLLSDQNNLVTLECDKNTVKTLTLNRDNNFQTFRIEPSALSLQKLCQKGWDTFPYEGEIPAGFSKVDTISFSDLEEKYQIQFDTLVADCEGALYYIFQDFPAMLNNIQTIIMENDYHELGKKNYVDAFMTSLGFSRIFSQGGGWGPCAGNFFEVWSK